MLVLLGRNYHIVLYRDATALIYSVSMDSAARQIQSSSK